jgi:hypothetical protein
MTPGAVDSVTGAKARPVPATINTGSLPPAVAKRIQALIRNNIERLVSNVGNQLAKATGSKLNSGRRNNKTNYSQRYRRFIGTDF